MLAFMLFQQHKREHHVLGASNEYNLVKNWFSKIHWGKQSKGSVFTWINQNLTTSQPAKMCPKPLCKSSMAPSKMKDAQPYEKCFLGAQEKAGSAVV